MARVSLEGFDEINELLRRAGDIPKDVKISAVEKMTAVAQDRVRDVGLRMGVRDPESKVHILDNITHTKAKETQDGAVSDVTFKGSRVRGKKKPVKTSNAEIAFINEYGHTGQPARPFIRTAAEQYADQIAAPGEQVIGDWFERTFGNS